MLYKNRRCIKFKRLKKFLLILIFLIVLFIVYFESCISEFKPEYIRIRAEVLANEKICDAVEQVLKNYNLTYDDIVKIYYSDNGVVQSVTTDSLSINKLKNDITRAVQKGISELYDNQVEIPFGAFTGITVLSNMGPDIPVNFCLTGSFSSELISTFEEAGINQTVHHIKLILTTKIMTTTLDYSGSITYITDYEIAQSVIIGNIPSSYGGLYRTY